MLNPLKTAIPSLKLAKIVLAAEKKKSINLKKKKLIK
jgi:hypothetical protein